MSQSIVDVSVHCIFSTKHRYPFIDSEIESSLHEYLGGICRTYGFTPLQIGGYTDHIHLLLIISKTTTIPKFIEELKKGSSKWIKTRGKRYANFYWQDGYAAFSISAHHRNAVVNYIKNQHQHHAQSDFKSECRALFREFDVPYDERYFWDE